MSEDLKEAFTKNAEEFDELMVKMLNRNEQQQQEINELKAYVELLREVVISCGQYVDDSYNRNIMIKAVQETPAQSINHIKKQVEYDAKADGREVRIARAKAYIERTREAFHSSIVEVDKLGDKAMGVLAGRIRERERKYDERSDEGGE